MPVSASILSENAGLTYRYLASNHVFQTWGATSVTGSSNLADVYSYACNVVAMRLLGSNIFVDGNIVLKGVIYDSNFNERQFGGGGTGSLSWTPTVTNAPLNAPSGAVFTYASCNASYRYTGNEVSYNVMIDGTVSTQTTNASADYTLKLPYPLNLSLYPSTKTVLGNMVLSVVYGGYSNNFQAYLRPVFTDSNVAAVRFISGTTDDTLASVAAGSKISLAGSVTYNTLEYSTYFYVPLSNVWQIGNGNVGFGTQLPRKAVEFAGDVVVDGEWYDKDLKRLYFAAGVDWRTWPAAANWTLPAGAAVTYTSSNLRYRYSGNEVALNYYLDTTITSAATSTTSDYKLSLPYPINTANYANGQIVGDCLVTIYVSGTSNNYKGYGRIDTSDANNLAIRVLTGTGEENIGQLLAGTRFVVSGNATYSTPAFSYNFNQTLSNVWQDPNGNVGIGTQVAASPLTINGDLRILSGNLVNANGEYINSPPVVWKTFTTSGVTLTAPALVTYQPTTSNARYRYSGYEVALNLYNDGQVTANTAAANADFTLNLPYVIDLSKYTANNMLGDMLLTVVSGGVSNNFKAYARVIANNSNALALRYLTGTGEAAFGTIPASTQFILSGNLTYATTAYNAQFTQGLSNVTQDPNTGYIGLNVQGPTSQLHVGGDIRMNGVMRDAAGNAAWIPGSTLTWQATQTPPTLTLPAGAVYTHTTQNGRFRYIGDEILYNAYVNLTMTTPPTNTSSNVQLSLPYPVKSGSYPAETIIGDLWLTVQTPTYSNVYPAFARTILTDVSNVTVRYLAGTTDETLSKFPANTKITLQGTLAYQTENINNLAQIAATYTPAAIAQDQNGQVVVNSGGYNPRGRLDIRQTLASSPALYVDKVAAGNARIATFSSNGTPVLSLGGDGLFYDGNGNSTFIPAGAVQWIKLNGTPTILPGAGGVLSLSSGTHCYKYGGNDLSYNFAQTFTVTSPPTLTTSDYTLNLPYILNTAAYSTNVIIGDLWANIISSNASFSNAYKAYARVNTTNGSNVTLRWLNGTADSSFSTLTSNVQVTLQGTITYTTASAALTAPVAPSVTRDVLLRDSDGRASMGTGQAPRARFDIYENSSIAPALMVDQWGTADILRVSDMGVVKFVVNSDGNVGIGSSTPIYPVHIVTSNSGPGVLINQVGAGDIMRIQDAGATKITVDANGNVGIGVTQPIVSLHLSGAIKNTNPSFFVYRNAGHVTAAATIIFNVASINIANGYNTSTGVFTAPVSGVYLFSIFGMSVTAGTNCWMQLKYGSDNTVVNNFNPYMGSVGATISYVQASGSTVVSLTQGASIYAYLAEGTLHGTGNAHNGFCGYLIG